MKRSNPYYRTAQQVEITTAAANPAVTTANAKTQLRVSIADDDTYIAALVSAATRYVEDRARRALVNTTFTARYRDFSDVLGLPRGKVSSITSVKYYAEGVTDSLTTVASSNYTLIQQGADAGAVHFKDSFDEPSVNTDDLSLPVEVVFVAGYGADDTAVPEGAQLAVKMLVAHWYDVRTPFLVAASGQQVPMSVETLIGQITIPQYADASTL